MSSLYTWGVIVAIFYVQVSSNGTVLHSEIVGAVKMKSFLSGMPELKLGLNDKLMFEATGRRKSMLRFSFFGRHLRTCSVRSPTLISPTDTLSRVLTLSADTFRPLYRRIRLAWRFKFCCSVGGLRR